MASPRDEGQLILLSAGVLARRRAMRERAMRLIDDVDWSTLGETLRLRRLLPTLGPRILDLAEGCASDDFAAAVERATTEGRRQGAFLQLISRRAMTMLAEVGIRCAPLKGPLLGEAIYGDPGRRVSSDIDLLVGAEQLHAAVEVVRQLGYAAPTDCVQEGGLPLLHFLLPHVQQKLPTVELHWRIHWYERDFARERLLPPEGTPSEDWHPAPIDQLVALLLFYARDGFVGLRLAADLSAWWDVFGAELCPGAFDELMRLYPALSSVTRVAAKVAEDVVGLPSTQVFGDIPRLSVRERVATRLANPNPHSSSSQLYADMGLVDGLLTPPRGFGAFVRRQVLPPRAVLDERARHAGEWRGHSPLGHCAGALGRYGLRMTSLLRAPETLR